MLSVFQVIALSLFVISCLYSIGAKTVADMKHSRGLLIISGLTFMAAYIVPELIK